MFKVFPSHQKVKCPRPGCEKSVRKDRLDSHLQKRHNEAPNTIPGQPKIFGFGGFKTNTNDKPATETVQQEQETVLTELRNLNQPDIDAEKIVQNQKEKEQAQETVMVELRNLRRIQEDKDKNRDVEKQKSAKDDDKPCCSKSLTAGTKPTVMASEPLHYGIPAKHHFDQFFEKHNKDNFPAAEKQSLPEEEIIDLDAETASIVDEQDLLGDLGNKNVGPQFPQLAKAKSTISLSKTKSFFQKLGRGLKRRKVFDSKSSVRDISSVDLLNDKLEELRIGLDEVKNSVTVLGSKLKNPANVEEQTIDPASTSMSLDNDSKIFNARKILIRHSKNLTELLHYCQEVRANESESNVVCHLCFDDTKQRLGLFKYNFLLEDEIIDDLARKRFANLKKNIISHLESKHHMQVVKNKEFETQQKKKLQSRNFKVGMILGRQAYKILKTADSYLQYETDVSVLAEQGMDVGNLNHSRKFAADFGKSVFNVLTKQMEKLVNSPLPATGRPSPISFISDKITPNRRTMQIVGFHGFIGGKVQSLVAGVPALLGEDGISVTATLLKGLESLNINSDELSSRLIGGAVDGEYLHLGVQNHLLEKFSVSGESKEWYTFQWDPAHMIELAEKKSRTTNKAISSTISTISNVSKSFSHGKSFRLLLEEAASQQCVGSDKLKEKARVPGHFSDTRFATYSSIVIQKWLHNYKYYYNLLNREQSDDLDKINNAPFLFSCGGLCDAYEVMANISNAVQKSSITPWEVTNIIKIGISTFEKMVENLKKETLNLSSIDKNLFPHLSSIVNEVSEMGEYKGCAVLSKQFTVNRTRKYQSSAEANCVNYEESLKTAGANLSSFISKFVTEGTSRFEEESSKNSILLVAENLFDVTKIIKDRPTISFQNDLSIYCTLAKGSGNLDINLSDDVLEKEYKTFVERVKILAPQFIFKPKPTAPILKNKPSVSKVPTVQKIPKVQIEYPERYNQIDLYYQLLKSPALYKDIGNILHLALTGICRTRCEAVVEGMGSVMGLHSQNRTTLNPKTVERETIIRWQAPHPAKDATRIIQESLDYHFNGRENWHFCTSWDKASHFMTSQVIERVNKTGAASAKIPF